MFYSPWCGHCRHFAPVWKQIANDHSTTVHFGALSCSDYDSVCNENQVKAYPSIKAFNVPGEEGGGGRIIIDVTINEVT